MTTRRMYRSIGGDAGLCMTRAFGWIVDPVFGWGVMDAVEQTGSSRDFHQYGFFRTCYKARENGWIKTGCLAWRDADRGPAFYKEGTAEPNRRALLEPTEGCEEGAVGDADRGRPPYAGIYRLAA